MMINSQKDFLHLLLKLAVPIILQELIRTSLNFVDVVMIGSMGDVAIASVGIGNQFTLIFIMVCVGFANGTGIFTAQFWGKKETLSIHIFQGIGFKFALAGALLFCLCTTFFPRFIVSLFSSDEAVIKAGADYLQIVGWSYPFFAMTFIYASVLRSTHNTLFPLISSLIALCTNTFLNYCLIFGKFGFPVLGIKGAAYASALARVLDFLIILGIIYGKKLPGCISWKELFRRDVKETMSYVKITLPLVFRSTFWMVGITVYNMIYGRIGTVSLAAFNIANTIFMIAQIFLVTLGQTCAVILGNLIGAKEQKNVLKYSKVFIVLSLLSALILGVMLFSTNRLIIGFFNLSPQGIVFCSGILMVLGVLMPLKGLNIIFNVGIFKSGGDTMFSLIIDLGGVWLIGIPAALGAAFILDWPIPLVILASNTEELIKVFLCFKRYLSRKWLKSVIF